MTAMPEHGVLDLPTPRRRGRQVYRDYTMERIIQERTAQGDTESVGGGASPVHEAPSLPPSDAPTPDRDQATVSAGDGGSRRGQFHTSNLVDRLFALYGPGEREDLRRMLFMRIERLVQIHGQRMMTLVREACISAQGRENPGNYFCRAVRLKIAEADWMEVLP